MKGSERNQRFESLNRGISSARRQGCWYKVCLNIYQDEIPFAKGHQPQAPEIDEVDKEASGSTIRRYEFISDGDHNCLVRSYYTLLTSALSFNPLFQQISASEQASEPASAPGLAVHSGTRHGSTRQRVPLF